LPQCVQTIFARADSGFYCWEAVQAYEKAKVRFILVARKTSRLLDRLRTLTGSPRTRPTPTSSANSSISPKVGITLTRFIALRYRQKENNPQEREQYQLFDTPEYIYRGFVTDMDRAIDLSVWFYNQRAGTENLIKESNNDAGLTQHPSGRWATNCVHFQMMLA
jgi:hypothetical protein